MDREPLSDELELHRRSCPSCSRFGDASAEVRRAFREPADDWPEGTIVLGKYEVIERVGGGGQGSVYKARDTETGNRVAIKRLPIGPHSIDEAKHAELIEHPNVYRIKMATAWDGWHVVVMNWVNGPTLSQRLREGPIPEKQAVTIFRGICEGVRAAHEHEVLHLDLKPENVLLRDGAVPVVADFGFASAKSAGRGGTPGYMAPEQERGERVDKRTDVFALGVILAELVPDASRRLRAVIERVRAESPEQRPATVAELVGRVDAAQRSWLWLGIPVAAAVSLAGAVGWMLLRHPSMQATAAQASMVSANARQAEPAAQVAAPGVEAPAASADLPAPAAVKPQTTKGAASAASTSGHAPVATDAKLSLFPGGVVAEATAKEAAGDGEGCLRALATVPASGDQAYLRGLCLMRAGRCDDGRRVATESMPSSLGRSPIAQSVAVLAAARCPADQLTGEERVYRAAQRVDAANRAEDPAACDRTGREFWGLYHRASPPMDYLFAFGVLDGATRCLAQAGRCDEARAMNRLQYRAGFSGARSGMMTDQGADSSFEQNFHCGTRAMPAALPVDGSAP
jgi:tRNA A-37 threonylcarbamoyl transferase component Bud32